MIDGTKQVGTMYCVMELVRSVDVNIPNTTIRVSWAKGMIGALPVFDSEESALEYANGARSVVLLAEVAAHAERDKQESTT